MLHLTRTLGMTEGARDEPAPPHQASIASKGHVRPTRLRRNELDDVSHAFQQVDHVLPLFGREVVVNLFLDVHPGIDAVLDVEVRRGTHDALHERPPSGTTM